MNSPLRKSQDLVTHPPMVRAEAVCPMNQALCEAAGEVLGSDASPHCRTRENDRSGVDVNLSLYYSISSDWRWSLSLLFWVGAKICSRNWNRRRARNMYFDHHPPPPPPTPDVGAVFG